MSGSASSLAKRCSWAKPGWLPETSEVGWPLLAEHRTEHAAAIAAWEKARGKSGEAAALRRLCDAVERAIEELDADFDATGPGSWRASYQELRASLRHRDLRVIPTGRAAVERWAAEHPDDPELIEQAERRERVRADAEAIGGLRTGILRNEPTHLSAGRVLSRIAAEVSEVRDRIGEEKAAA